MADELMQKLAGCWDLVEAHFTRSDGTKMEPWGPLPTGMFIVTQKGEVSAHVMRTKRNRFASEQPTPEEKQRAYDDCLSYFGQVIRIDSEAGTLATHVIGATNANWVGGEQLRYFDLRDEDHIVLRTPPLDWAGVELVGTLAWARRK
jgi:lipocalin-like protein